MQNNHLFLTLCQVGMQSCCGMGADVHWRRSQQTGGDNEYCWSASDDKKSFIDTERDIGEMWKQALQQSMLEAGQREREIAIQKAIFKKVFL